MADNQRNNVAATTFAPPAATAACNTDHIRMQLFVIYMVIAIIFSTIVVIIVAFIKTKYGRSSQSEQSTLGGGGPIFYVESMNVSSFKAPASQITAGNLDIAIRVANNGTSELHYDKVQVYVRYKGQLLSHTAVGPINVAPEEYTTLQARLGASQPHNIDNQIAADKTQEAVDFNVELKATYKRMSGRKFVEDGKSTSVDCGDKKVEFSADTNIWTMLGAPSTCKVQV